MLRWITDGWVSYVHSIIPRDATETQIQETRRAFYAGAQHYHGVLATLDADAKPGERDRILQDIERELQGYLKVLGTREEQLANALERNYCGITAGAQHGQH